jgi:hypothetical protein
LIRIGRISLEELETEVPDPRLKIALSAYVQGDMEVIELKMLKYSSFQLNAAKYGVFQPFQLGRRLNPPRRLVEGILNIIGGSIIEIEDDESFTYQMLLPISS